MWWVALAWAQPLVLPAAPGEGAPSALVVHGPAQALGQVDYCLSCHPGAVGHGVESAHGQASLNNPWYLSAFVALRADVGAEASQHCGGCHDPVLLATGALKGSVGPQTEGADLGVSCLSCHGGVAASPDGNASLVIDLRDLPDPVVEVADHRERMRPDVLLDGSLCQGCHRGVLLPAMGAPHVAMGIDDWGSWLGSAWAGTEVLRLDPDPPRATCVDCHTAGTGGGRTSLDPDHRLDEALTLTVPAAWVDGVPQALDDGWLDAPTGAEVVVEAVVWNTGAGHDVPGGLADIQDLALLLQVEDPSGRWTARGPTLRSLPLDTDGLPVRDHQAHRIALSAFDHTVPPGEAQVLRVAFQAVGGSTRVGAELWHRPHREALADAACAVTGPFTLDGCAPSPLTRLSTADAHGAEAMYALALGRARGTSEDLAGALWALDSAERRGLDPDRAAVLRARVLGRQGRVDDALAVLEGRPDHPAVHAARGRALMAVWRFEEAVEAWEAVVEAAPRSVEAWASLARSRGSIGDDTGALEAAREGLRHDPRDVSLLRTQALAARALGHAQAEAAEAAWLAHRPPDGTDRLRMVCDRADEECAQRRAIPVVRVP